MPAWFSSRWPTETDRANVSANESEPRLTLSSMTGRATTGTSSAVFVYYFISTSGLAVSVYSILPSRRGFRRGDGHQQERTLLTFPPINHPRRLRLRRSFHLLFHVVPGVSVAGTFNFHPRAISDAGVGFVQVMVNNRNGLRQCLHQRSTLERLDRNAGNVDVDGRGGNHRFLLRGKSLFFGWNINIIGVPSEAFSEVWNIRTVKPFRIPRVGAAIIS